MGFLFPGDDALGNEINFKGLGEAIEATAGALKSFLDGIAHGLSLASQGYTTAKASRDRKRLKYLYKFTGDYLLTQGAVHSRYDDILSRYTIHGDTENDFEDSDLDRQWSEFCNEIQEILPRLNRLIRDWEAEFSDFILEEQYYVIRRATDRRSHLFRQLIGLERPKSQPEIQEARKLLDEWKVLMDELDRSVSALGQYLAEN